MQKGGCDNGQAVVDAFGRMLKQGQAQLGMRFLQLARDSVLAAKSRFVGSWSLYGDALHSKTTCSFRHSKVYA